MARRLAAVPEPEPELLQEVTVTITQLAPFTENLPRCLAINGKGEQCWFYARFQQNGTPTCGVHLGRPGTLFIRRTR